jgi:hypothetical protein
VLCEVVAAFTEDAIALSARKMIEFNNAMTSLKKIRGRMKKRQKANQGWGIGNI